MDNNQSPVTTVNGTIAQLLRPIEFYQRWQYKNTALLLVSLAVFIALSGYPAVADFFAILGSIGYVGAFLAGLLSVSIFTVAPAAIIIFDVAQTLDPLLVALVAAVGAALGDYLVLRVVSVTIFEELEPLFRFFGGPLVKALFHSPYFQWLMPFIGAFIIAAPVLPDELGVSILGLAKLPRWRFFLIAFLLNALGIFVIVAAAAR